MRVIVIGAGDIGLPIIKHLSERGNLLTVIENDEKKCKKIANSADAAIYCGDSTDLEIWKNPEVGKSDVLFALTNRDEVNIKACEIAKKQFGIPFVIARARQPEFVERMKEAGADVVICPSVATRRLFLNALESRSALTLFEHAESDFKIILVTVPANGTTIGKTVNELELGENSRVAAVFRNNSFDLPAESFMFKGEDRVLLAGKTEQVEKAAEKLRNVEVT